MRSSKSKIPRIHCETCRKELEPGVRAFALEDSTIGRQGFVSLLECHEVPIFCCEEHVLEHQIYEDSRSYQGQRMQPSSQDCPQSKSSIDLCVPCGIELSYTMRALRLTESRIDELGFAPPQDAGELFCSKRCCEESLTLTSNKSLTEFWEDLLRRVDRQSGMNA